MKKLLFAMLVISSGLVFAGENSAKEMDRKAILAQAGSFVVDFHFKETAGFEMGYEIKEAYDAAALETVIVVEDASDRIVLQHVLQTKRGVIKHWRQDWEYQSRVLWEYLGDKTWTKRELSEDEARGTWVQRVFQVDDSPRYESLGRWTHIGNLSQWESELTFRPLPRREYTKRDDYNILAARNRHALTPTGWIHEQDNYKLRRKDGEDHVIAREFGLNRYDHTQEDKLAEAIQWWEDHKVFWTGVRGYWDKLFASQDRLVLKGKVDDKPMYRHLFDLSAEVGTTDKEELHRRAVIVIDQFREDTNSSASVD